MEPIGLTCHPDRTEVVFGAILDVSRVRAAHSRLDEVLRRGLPVELHAGAVERLDTAGAQLLLAFLHTARERGLKPQWRAVGSAVRASAATLGVTSALELPA